MADLIYSADNLTPSEPNNVNEVKAIKTETAAYVNGSGWVDSNRLASGAVTTAKLADDAVTSAKLADDAVVTDAIANDAVTAAELADAAKLGLTEGGVVRRGKAIIATEESTTSSSYTYLTTPDRVQNVVLPTDGLIFVAYTAAWKQSVDNTARAAIFVGNQLKVHINGSAPAVSEASIGTGSGSTNYAPLSSVPGGLQATTGYPTPYGAVTTGQAIVGQNTYATNPSGVGGICTIFAAAGTYDIGIKFKTSSGTVTAKERKLWVWTMGF